MEVLTWFGYKFIPTFIEHTSKVKQARYLDISTQTASLEMCPVFYFSRKRVFSDLNSVEQKCNTVFVLYM